jgi:hypothetical protein
MMQYGISRINLYFKGESNANLEKQKLLARTTQVTDPKLFMLLSSPWCKRFKDLCVDRLCLTHDDLTVGE